MSGIPFPQLGVYFVSREPVRAPPPLAAFAAVRAALEKGRTPLKLAGSLSAATQNRFAIAACPEGLGRAPESALVEVYEYDPVRYQAMVIGLVEPPAETPVHWIARRVNPQASVVAVVPDPPALPTGTAVAARPRGYLGDPQTLLAIGRLVKGQDACAIEGVGLVLIGADAAGIALAARRVLRPAAKTAKRKARPDRPAKRTNKSRK